MDHGIVSGLTTGLTAVVVSFFAQWAIRRTRNTAELTEDGWRRLDYPMWYAALGWIGFLMFFGIGIAASFFDKGDSSWLGIALVELGFLTFALLSFSLVGIYHRCRLLYRDDEAVYFPLWGGAQRFRWRDIASIRFSNAAKWWRLRLSNGKSVRISIYMHGAMEFMQVLANRTTLGIPPAILQSGERVHIPQART